MKRIPFCHNSAGRLVTAALVISVVYVLFKACHKDGTTGRANESQVALSPNVKSMAFSDSQYVEIASCSHDSYGVVSQVLSQNNVEFIALGSFGVTFAVAEEDAALAKRVISNLNSSDISVDKLLRIPLTEECVVAACCDKATGQMIQRAIQQKAIPCSIVGDRMVKILVCPEDARETISVIREFNDRNISINEKLLTRDGDTADVSE